MTGRCRRRCSRRQRGARRAGQIRQGRFGVVAARPPNRCAVRCSVTGTAPVARRAVRCVGHQWFHRGQHIEVAIGRGGQDEYRNASPGLSWSRPAGRLVYLRHRLAHLWGNPCAHEGSDVMEEAVRHAIAAVRTAVRTEDEVIGRRASCRVSCAALSRAGGGSRRGGGGRLRRVGVAGLSTAVGERCGGVQDVVGLRGRATGPCGRGQRVHHRRREPAGQGGL